MTLATQILVGIAILMSFYAWRRKDGSLKKGLIQGRRTLTGTLPLLLLAFLIVGFVNVLEPEELVSAWIGPESGWGGVLIGTAAGMVLPGGPYVVFPLIATLYSAGAGLGPMLAMITSWSGLAFISISFELPFLGWRFSVIRIGLMFLFPILVGAAGMIFF
jgi:uncharacterized protein